MNRIIGFRAHRLERNLTIQEVAEMSEVSLYTVRCCEEGRVDCISMEKLIALTETLEISFAEACSFREPVGPRKRPRRKEPHNVLEHYMARWNLTAQGMADLLGVSVQTVCIQCGKSTPAMKYVRRLAEAEGMPVETFLQMYQSNIWAQVG